MKRRFIAGAVCPSCEKQDKIVMYDDEEGRRWRECVSCGFKDLLQEQPADEPRTRVNQPRPGETPLPHEEEINVVSVIDPKKLH